MEPSGFNGRIVEGESWLNTSIQHIERNINTIREGHLLSEENIKTIFSEAKRQLEGGSRPKNLSEFKFSLMTIKVHAKHYLNLNNKGQTQQTRICQALSNGVGECLRALEELKWAKSRTLTAYDSEALIEKEEKPFFTAETAHQEIIRTGVFHQDILNKGEKYLIKQKVDVTKLSAFTYWYCQEQFKKMSEEDVFLIRKSSRKPDEADKVYYVISHQSRIKENLEIKHRYLWQTLSTGKWHMTADPNSYDSAAAAILSRYSESTPILPPLKRAKEIACQYMN